MNKKFSIAVFVFLFIFQTVFALDIDDKIGQMIMVGFDGNTVNSNKFKKTYNTSINAVHTSSSNTDIYSSR